MNLDIKERAWSARKDERRKDMKKTTTAAEVKETAKKEVKATVSTKGSVVATDKPVRPAKRSDRVGAVSIVKPEEARAAEEKKADAKIVEKPSVKAVNAPQPAFSENDRKHYTECISLIAETWRQTQESTLKTAFVLYDVYTSGLYRIDNYKNIQEFALDKFGFRKTTVYSLINVVERFGAKIENGKPVHQIDDKYSGFSQSQLDVMLGHTDDELSSVRPEMSVREIRKLLAKPKNADSPENAEARSPKGKSGADCDAPSEPEFRANLIHEFNTVAEWDNMLNAEDELDYKLLLSVIRKCLASGHSVRILDCFTTDGGK